MEILQNNTTQLPYNIFYIILCMHVCIENVEKDIKSPKSVVHLAAFSNNIFFSVNWHRHKEDEGDAEVIS